MNVYSELLNLLREKKDREPPAVFGVLSAAQPVAVTLRGTRLTKGLFYPAGTVFRSEDVGREVLLLPCEEGLYIVGFVEGGPL